MAFFNEPDFLQVASSTVPAKLAGAIAEATRKTGRITLNACGAGAVNQAVKATAIARGYVITGGHDLVISPVFKDTQFEDGNERTVMALEVIRVPARTDARLANPVPVPPGPERRTSQ